MRFAEPWWLLLLLALPLAAWVVTQRRRRRVAAPVPSDALLGTLESRMTRQVARIPTATRFGALALLALALARPQIPLPESHREASGLDIMLLIDTSRSMEARDFMLDGDRPSRLAVVKRVIGDFIKARPDDRIGLVIFGTEAFTQSPLTLDHDVLARFLDRVDIGMAGDATAIGDALATAVNRLKDLDAKSRVAILLSDGGNTAGRIDPLAATAAAKAKGVKVYTIGIGSNGEVPVVINGRTRMQKVEIDEELLKQVADGTGGSYFQAADTEALVKIYDTINQLEKTRRQSEIAAHEAEEDFPPLAVAALVFAAFELSFALTRFRRVP